MAKTQMELSKKNQELAIKAGHKQLSELVGRPVDGGEKISEVFSGLVDKKFNDLFRAPNAGGEINQKLPLIFTLVLLLTIYPVGLVLSLVWFMIVGFVFFCLRRWGVISVKTITVSKEVLE
jgi:hypothetical protein